MENKPEYLVTADCDIVASFDEIEDAIRDGIELARRDQLVAAMTAPTATTVVNRYYAYRKYADPTAEEALMWLVTEIYELVDAYYSMQTDGQPTHVQRSGLPQWVKLFQLVAGDVERLVAGKKSWVRNNQPKHTYDLPGEVGDIEMMLNRFALAAGLPEPERCMMDKFRSKGFVDGAE